MEYLTQSGEIICNPSVAELYEEILKGGEGSLAEGGPLVTQTGKYTGRSANDKYVVSEANTEDKI